MYKDADMDEPPIGDWVDVEAAEAGVASPTAAFGKLPKRRLDRARAGYYALITHIDNQIGRLLQALDEYGALSNTLIVFTSDHGELLGDHHYFRKSLPYEGSAKIPLIVFDPGGQLGLKRGIRPSQVTELRDIMPTLLDAAGAPIPAQVEGQSLLPLCRGGQDVSWRSYIHGEHSYGALSNHYVTDGNEKYIWFSKTGHEQLFDLRHDPQELNDLARMPEAVERVAAWRLRLVGELTGREEGYVKDGMLVAGQQPLNVLQHIRPIK
jgi:arylsulfatase A-like enzyme